MNLNFDGLAKVFFSKIDTSRQFLLIGDTNHDIIEYDRLIYSEPFIRAAVAAGYKYFFHEVHVDKQNYYEKISNNALSFVRSVQSAQIGMRTVQKEVARLLRATSSCHEEVALVNKWLTEKNVTDEHARLFVIACFISQFLEVKMVMADPRTGELKKEYQAQYDELLDQLKKGMISQEQFSLANLSSREHSLSHDNKLWDFIKEKSQNQKAVICYGAAHFSTGSTLEAVVPRSDRTIVNLWLNQEKIDQRILYYKANGLSYAGDVIDFVLEQAQQDVSQNQTAFVSAPLKQVSDNQVLVSSAKKGNGVSGKKNVAEIQNFSRSQKSKRPSIWGLVKPMVVFLFFDAIACSTETMQNFFDYILDEPPGKVLEVGIGLISVLMQVAGFTAGVFVSALFILLELNSQRIHEQKVLRMLFIAAACLGILGLTMTGILATMSEPTSAIEN